MHLKAAVPALSNRNALKAQFDWLTDGGIGRNIFNNLAHKLRNLELFLRYVKSGRVVRKGVRRVGGGENGVVEKDGGARKMVEGGRVGKGMRMRGRRMGCKSRKEKGRLKKSNLLLFVGTWSVQPPCSKKWKKLKGRRRYTTRMLVIPTSGWVS